MEFKLDCQCTVLQLSTYQAWVGARYLDFGLNFQTHPYFNEGANDIETGLSEPSSFIMLYLGSIGMDCTCYK